MTRYKDVRAVWKVAERGALAFGAAAKEQGEPATGNKKKPALLGAGFAVYLDVYSKSLGFSVGRSTGRRPILPQSQVPPQVVSTVLSST